MGLAQFLRPKEVAHAGVDGRVDVLQQLRGVAIARRLVPRFHEGHAWRVGEAPAEADARAHAPAPGKTPVERLEVTVELPGVRLEPALLAAQQPGVPGDHDRPAVRALDERPPDLEGIAARATVRRDRAATH